VLLCLRVTVLLGHAKVDYVDDIRGLCTWSTNEKIVGFDVTVDEVLLVNCLDARQLLGISKRRLGWISMTYHLFGNHHNGLDRELSMTMIEEVFKAWAEQVNDQDVVKAFLTKVINIRNTGYTTSDCVKLIK